MRGTGSGPAEKYGIPTGLEEKMRVFGAAAFYTELTTSARNGEVSSVLRRGGLGSAE